MATVRRRALVGCLAAALLVAVAVPAQAGAESSFVSKINAARAEAGKAPVQVYWDLTDDARAHAKRMRDQGRLFFNPNVTSATTGWNAIAEVIGVGDSVGSIFDAFMASSSHRSTILGGFNYVGVGPATEPSGQIWVDMIFMHGPDDLLDPPATTTTTEPPSTTTTTEPPSTTTTTEPPSTTTTTEPPSTTTTVPPGGTTTTTTQAPGPDVPSGNTQGAAFAVSPVELAVLDGDWVPPDLMRPFGFTR